MIRCSIVSELMITLVPVFDSRHGRGYPRTSQRMTRVIVMMIVIRQLMTRPPVSRSVIGSHHACRHSDDGIWCIASCRLDPDKLAVGVSDRSQLLRGCSRSSSVQFLFFGTVDVLADEADSAAHQQNLNTAFMGAGNGTSIRDHWDRIGFRWHRHSANDNRCS